MPDFIGAIDQGTTSTRFIVFDRSGRIVTVAQKEHQQIYPRPGWVEHDPQEIWQRTEEVIAEAMRQKSLAPSDLAAIGITNQRETTILWDRRTGEPVGNAIVWQDVRVEDAVAQLSREGGQAKTSDTRTPSVERFGKELSSLFREPHQLVHTRSDTYVHSSSQPHNSRWPQRRRQNHGSRGHTRRRFG